MTEDLLLKMKAAIGEAARNLLAAGARTVVVQGNEKWGAPTTGLSRNYIHNENDITKFVSETKLFPNYSFLAGLHMMGGNKIGTASDNSVVSGKHQVWGREGLYVVDGSVFPDSVGSHPMFSIYAIAKLFTEQFPEENK
jgi:choline dehydrogenase-like flavoprotein